MSIVANQLAETFAVLTPNLQVKPVPVNWFYNGYFLPRSRGAIGQHPGARAEVLRVLSLFVGLLDIPFMYLRSRWRRCR